MAARMAAKKGYTNIKVFHAGAPAWQKNGKPLLTNYNFVSKRLDNVVLIDSEPPGVFDRAAIQAVYKWKFKPRIQDGKAVPVRAEQTVNFKLGK